MGKASKSIEAMHKAYMGSRKQNPVDCHVGCRLRSRRVLLGISQEQLAEKLNLAPGRIKNWEQGSNWIPASDLFNIACVLGVTVPFFYEGAQSIAPRQADADDQAGNASIAEFLHSGDGLQLNEAFVRIAHAGTRRAVVVLARNVADQCASNKRQHLSFMQGPNRTQPGSARSKRAANRVAPKRSARWTNA
jgi:transcriptional regulator with XRE-family HTH domain